MNADVTKELYELRYSTQMNYEQFVHLLEKGMSFLDRSPVIDKLTLSRLFRPEDIKAVNIALEYNQEMMVKHLTS